MTLKGIQRNQISNIKQYYDKNNVILSGKIPGFSIESIIRITSDLSETPIILTITIFRINYVHILFLN